MKNIFTKSKIRIAIAAAVAVILSGMSIGAVWGDGLQGGKLALALLLSVMAGVAVAVKGSFPRKMGYILAALLPFGALCCMEFYTHVPWDLTVLITVLNYLFYLILYLIFTFLFGNARWGYLAGPVLPMLFGAVNYFVVSFRSSPVVPWDVFSLGTAVTITDNYTFSLSYRFVFVVLGFVWLMILGEKLRLTVRKTRIRLAALAVSVVLMFGYVSLIQVEAVEDAFGMDDILFTPNVLYRNNGFMAAFLANLRYLDVEKPQGYSADAAEHIRSMYEKEEGGLVTDSEDLSEKPNIIVIMNEAFADLSVYGDFETSSEYMPFIRSLQKNTVKGNLYVSVKGGNTANTEFEFLTGNSMAFMPAGSVPYQQFVKSEMPSLASQLGSLGYTTAALHPYYASGWNRDQVYPDLGFEDTYFRDDFTNASTLRGYVDDRSAFEKLMELYEDKEENERLFAFEVTMQNHGGYSKEYPDLEPEILLSDIPEEQKGTQIHATEKYLTLVKKTDEAFEELLQYFSNQNEKTIILMFGDHQPSDYICNPILRMLGLDENARDSSLEEFSKGYIVPFVMWANYDMEAEEVDAISANYLSTLLMEKAGLPKTGYQEYLTQLQKDFPVVTANFFMSGEEQAFHELSENGADDSDRNSLNSYAILQYNNIVDSKRRLEGFFGDSLLTNN